MKTAVLEKKVTYLNYVFNLTLHRYSLHSDTKQRKERNLTRNWDQIKFGIFAQ